MVRHHHRIQHLIHANTKLKKTTTEICMSNACEEKKIKEKKKKKEIMLYLTVY